MIFEETIGKLMEMKLPAMAQRARDLMHAPPSPALCFEEQLGLLVDHEWSERQTRRLARRLSDAKLPMSAELEDVVCEPTRGLDKPALRALGHCQWIRARQNILVIGATGVGKSYLGAALCHTACRHGHKTLCARVPRLLQTLAIARADGSYRAELAKLARTEVLMLDDFLIAPLTDVEQRDLLEVLEDRYDKSSTLITTQLPTKNWHQAMKDPTLADAICDRLVHNAHVLSLKGPSMRRTKTPTPQTST